DRNHLGMAPVTSLPEPAGGRGKTLEGLLDLVHDRYWLQHKILVTHYGTSGRYFFKDGKSRFAAFKKARQPVDYHGSIRGRLVVFDAKGTKNKTRWRLDARYQHQVDRLVAWSRSGALAWFAVEQRVANRLWLLRVHPDMLWATIDFSDPVSSDLLIVNPSPEGLYEWLPLVLDNWLRTVSL
ncbi:MAG: Holliday junction resolvase RecU, partial [Candidatus Hydrogenedentes bacterium]|nr:Holliday junction resolvase RecU [Candidatus Hydrogenedentota bacterium]